MNHAIARVLASVGNQSAQIEGDAGEEPSFCDAKEKAEEVGDSVVPSRKIVAAETRPPGDHDPRQPDTRADSIQRACCSGTSNKQ